MGHSMAALQSTSPRLELQLLPSRSFCHQPSRGRYRAALLQVKFRRVSFLSFTSALSCCYRAKQRTSSPTSSMQSVSFLLLSKLSPQQGWDQLAAKDQRIFGGGYSSVKCSMSVPCYEGIISQPSGKTRSPIAEYKDKFNKGFRKAGRRRTKLEQRIQKGFEKVGLERQFGELPEWSANVPPVAAGLETLVIVSWTVFLKGDLRGSNTFNLSGEGLLTLLLGTNFVVGWLASQMSTWRVQALSPSLLGRDKRAASPGVLDFIRSFFVNMIPYGNFLAWTRFAWKESSAVSSLNALVYVVPSLVRLVLWSQGWTIGRVELLAWFLGFIHRPYDAARVQNEKLLDSADARIENARRAKEETEQRENGPELTVEEMAILQQRKELEEFDVLLARSTNNTTSSPGPAQDWSVGDTLQWLAQEGFARYASAFADNDIDGAVLLLLTSDDLRDELGIQSLGDRRKLTQAIQHLK